MQMMAAGTLTVVDGNDHTAVAGVSVIASNGMIVGVTDAGGCIRVAEKDYSLSFRSLGYESAIMEIPRDSISLLPATYALSEVLVNPASPYNAGAYLCAGILHRSHPLRHLAALRRIYA